MKTILGARIRERRRGQGITQAELARRLGISPSYLNLIEHNKRGIAGALLRRTADALGLELSELDGAAERRLLEQVDEIAHIPYVAALGVERGQAGELIGRFPGWARAIAALARAEREASDTARALADRITHDPFLGDAVHRMLTHIASLRSAVEILVEHDDLDAPRRQRFLRIVAEESRSLTAVGEALATYFDRADSTERVVTPLGEMEALFDARGNRFEELEQAADVGAAALDDGAANPGGRSARARALAQRRLGTLVDGIIERSTEVETELAREQARAALLTYARDALIAPMARFEPLARQLRYDAEALAEAFAVSMDTVARRLCALPVDDTTPRFGYLCANAAGTLIEARSLPGLVTPRFASACPLWVLYRAQQSPETTIRQRTSFPTGERFVFIARARSAGGPSGFGQPRHYVTDMLTMSESDASHTVYEPDGAVPVEPVGMACRSCPRRDCAHRVIDPLAG